MPENPNAAELQTGEIFEGKYRIIRELGRGGFGMVYLAYQEMMDRHVALKVLRPGISITAPSAKERFLREVRIISKLKHPNTVTIHDFGETLEGGLYMTLEFVEGETLKQILRRDGPIISVRAADVARQIARSLSEAHRHGVVHRDLKPANIMITNIEGERDFVKVLDFGVARLLDPKTSDLTSVGLPDGERELIGTPRYMSPEQVRGESLTGASDIYGLGLILYEMLTGEPAVQGDTTMGLITQQISPDPLQLPMLHACDPLVQDVIRIATAKPVQERFQTADQVAEALQNIVHRYRGATGSNEMFMQSYQSQLMGMQPPNAQSGWTPQSGPWPVQQTPSGGWPAHQTGAPLGMPPSGMHPSPESENFNESSEPVWASPPPGSERPSQGFESPDPYAFGAIDLEQGSDPIEFQETIERSSLRRTPRNQAEEENVIPSFSELPPPPSHDSEFEPIPEPEPTPAPRTTRRQAPVRNPVVRDDDDLLAFSVTVIKVLLLSSATVVLLYAFFLTIGAALGRYLDGTWRLVGSAILTVTLPLLVAVAESSQRERFKVAKRASHRMSRILLGSTLILGGAVFLTGAIAADSVIRELRTEPNWFLGRGTPDDSTGKTFNRNFSHVLADTVAKSMQATGLYDARDIPPATAPEPTRLPAPTRTKDKAGSEDEKSEKAPLLNPDDTSQASGVGEKEPTPSEQPSERSKDDTERDKPSGEYIRW